MDLSSILQKLERAQESFLSATDAISPEGWATKPSREVWCAAEVTAHVALVERTVTNAAIKVIQKLPKPFWFWQRVHFPLWLVEARVIRRKSPIPMDKALIGTKIGCWISYVEFGKKRWHSWRSRKLAT